MTVIAQVSNRDDARRVALLGYNNDGLLDTFLVNAGRVRDPMRSPAHFDRHNPSYWNRLYRQNKDGSFTDVTSQTGLANAGETNYGMGVAGGEYENDAFPDVYVTNFGKNILYHNNGDGTFKDVTTKAGVAAGGWSASAGFLTTIGTWIFGYALPWIGRKEGSASRHTICGVAVFRCGCERAALQGGGSAVPRCSKNICRLLFSHWNKSMDDVNVKLCPEAF